MEELRTGGESRRLGRELRVQPDYRMQRERPAE
jgi:hypothetical protein